MAFLFQVGAGTPVGNVTPRSARDWYQDTNTGDLWVATGPTPNDWQRQTDPAAIGGGGGSVGPVETRTQSGAIAAADNGKTLFVPTGNTLTLTFDAGLPDGFEIHVIADANSEVTIQPATGQRMANGEQPPRYEAVDAPLVSPKLAQQNTEQIATGKWKLSGTSWLPLLSATGWATPSAATLFWVAQNGVDTVGGTQTSMTVPDADQNDPATWKLMYGDPQQPQTAQDADITNLDIDGTLLVDAGVLNVALPWTDPTNSLTVTDIQPATPDNFITIQTSQNQGTLNADVTSSTAPQVNLNFSIEATPPQQPSTQTFWWDQAAGTYTDGSSLPVTGAVTYQFMDGDPQNPGAAQAPGIDALNLDPTGVNTALVLAGSVNVALPYTDPATGVRFTAIDVNTGEVTFDNVGASGGSIDLFCNYAPPPGDPLTVTLQVTAPAPTLPDEWNYTGGDTGEGGTITMSATGASADYQHLSAAAPAPAKDWTAGPSDVFLGALTLVSNGTAVGTPTTEPGTGVRVTNIDTVSSILTMDVPGPAPGGQILLRVVTGTEQFDVTLDVPPQP